MTGGDRRVTGNVCAVDGLSGADCWHAKLPIQGARGSVPAARAAARRSRRYAGQRRSGPETCSGVPHGPLESPLGWQPVTVAG